MINNVSLTGRLTKDSDLRFTSNAKAVANFTLAVNRQFKNQQGEQEADFINCVAWNKTAEALANYTRKGSLVGVEGSIQTRNYENQQGQRVYVTEILVQRLTFLESQKTGAGDSSSSPQANTQSNHSNQTNSQNRGYNSNNDPFINSGQPIEINDDDLPF